jgi:hypothetical protein
VFLLLSSFKHQDISEDTVDDNPENVAIIGWLRAYWSSAWREFAEDNKIVLSARFTIKRFNEGQENEQLIGMAINELITDLKEILPSAEKKLGLPAEKHEHVKDEKTGKWVKK